MSERDALKTCLSRIDGEAGTLHILSTPLADIAQRYRYTTLAKALWQVYDLPVTDFDSAQQEAFEALLPLRDRLHKHTAISALRLGLEYAQPDSAAPITMTLMMALLLHLNPKAQLSHHEDTTVLERFLRALHEGSSDPVSTDLISAQSEALSTYLMTVSDHGLNASTYTSRVISSTGSDLRACVQGALGALQGPLHGGAPGPVLDMLDSLRGLSEAEIAEWVQEQLRQKIRIMGFGHRIYRVRDPRADVLKSALHHLQNQGFNSARLQQAEVAEKVILKELRQHKPERVLQTNVEYYTALLLEGTGFPRSSFTAVFALGRVLGWCAHAAEQQAIGRLIRPKGTYFEQTLSFAGNKI